MSKPLNLELMEELIDSYKTIEILKEENKRLSYNIKMMEAKLRDWRENNPMPKETFGEKNAVPKETVKKEFLNTGCSAGQNPDKDPIGVRGNTTFVRRDEDPFIKAVFDALVN